MAIQDFVTGQVLTSTEMDNLQKNDYNQTVSAKTASYVLVAADKGTRITMSNAGATTITVNTSLFAAGDTLFITNIGAGASTITAGTATVSTISTLVLSQYDSGTLYFTSAGVAIWQKFQGAAAASGALTKIVTGNFSASAGVAINGCFDSTYTNYMIVLNALGNSAGTFLYLQMQYSTSTVESGANYYAGGKYVTNGSVDSFYVNNNDTKFTIAPTVAVGTTQAFTMNFSNVGNSSQSPVIYSLGNGAGNGIATMAGLCNSNRIFTGVYLTGSGNLTGTYTVYGLAK
jgi:hypothetical protein